LNDARFGEGDIKDIKKATAEIDAMIMRLADPTPIPKTPTGEGIKFRTRIIL
jgi:hypothetical protein